MSSSLSKEDEALYDRQIRLWGFAAQEKLLSSHVYIIGASAINIEVAKNLLLAGIRLSLGDGRLATESDLGYNFFLREEDLGKGIAECCYPRIQEMNPNVKVQQADANPFLLENDAEDLTKIVKDCSAVLVACELVPLHRQLDIDEICRVNGTAFFSSWSLGKHACCFADMVERPKSLKDDTESHWGGNLQRCPSLRESLECSPTSYPIKTDYSFYAFLALFKSQIDKDKDAPKKTETVESPPPEESACSQGPAQLLHEVEPGIKENACNLLEKLIAHSGCELPAAAAVIGGVIAQEIRKLCTKKDMPLGNWIALNCDESAVVQVSIPKF